MTEPVSEAAFSSDLTKFRQSFEEIQAEFIGAPRAAVEKAEALIDGLMTTLHDQLQRIHSDVKTDADTEQLRGGDAELSGVVRLARWPQSGLDA